MNKHKHNFYMDRGTCFCRVKECPAFHTICYDEAENFNPLVDRHLEKNNEIMKVFAHNNEKGEIHMGSVEKCQECKYKLKHYLP